MRVVRQVIDEQLTWDGRLPLFSPTASELGEGELWAGMWAAGKWLESMPLLSLAGYPAVAVFFVV